MTSEYFYGPIWSTKYVFDREITWDNFEWNLEQFICKFASRQTWTPKPWLVMFPTKLILQGPKFYHATSAPFSALGKHVDTSIYLYMKN